MAFKIVGALLSITDAYVFFPITVHEKRMTVKSGISQDAIFKRIQTILLSLIRMGAVKRNTELISFSLKKRIKK